MVRREEGRKRGMEGGRERTKAVRAREAGSVRL